MSQALTSFSPDILHSYELLQNYLLGESTDLRVREKVTEAARHPESNWLGTWKVAPLMAKEFANTMLSIFASAISSLLFAIGLKTWSYQLSIRADLAESDTELGSFWAYGNNLLVPAANVYSSDSLSLYLHSPLPKSEIRDQRVRSLINPFINVLSFDENDGVCRGEALWFLRHYFKTKALFHNSREHMRALGRLFSSGAPPEAALLQKLCPDPKFLGLIRSDPIYIDVPQSDDPIVKRNAISQIFQNVQPGAYTLNTPDHAMAFICTDDGQKYFFDPNFGTIALRSQENFQQLAKNLLHYEGSEARSGIVLWPTVAVF